MIKVFISYSHDNDTHQQRMHALADRLRNDGVDIILDRDCGPGGPDEGWDKWSEKAGRKNGNSLAGIHTRIPQMLGWRTITGDALGAIRELKVLDRRLYNAGNEVNFCRIRTIRTTTVTAHRLRARTSCA